MTDESNDKRKRTSRFLLKDTDQALVDRAFGWFERKVFNLHRVDEDSIVRRRVILLSVFTSVGLVTLVFFGILAFFQGAPLLGYFDIAFAMVLMLNLLDARNRKNYQFNIYVGVITASCLYVFLYINGGINHTAFVWYFTFPLPASFLLGSKKGLIAMLLMTIPVIVLTLFDLQHPFFATYSQAFVIRFLGAYLLVGVFAYIFEKAGENSRKEILEINKNLEEIVGQRTVELTSLNQKLLQEIEQHKKAQILRTKSDQRYKALVDLAVVGILVGSKEGYILEANKCICDIVGVRRDDLIGRHISTIAFTQESSIRNPLRFELLKVGETVTRERDILQPDGTKVTVEMRTVMMPDGTYQSIFTDITQRKRVEQRLQASEELFRQAFHTSPDSVEIIKVTDGTFVDINDGFTKNLGYSRDDVVGRSALSLNIWKNPGDRRLFVEGLQEKGFVENVELELLSKSGESRYGLTSASILCINEEDLILSITRDITDRKRRQEEKIRVEGLLQQAQKMEAIGTLAGGIAHDFNNLLMGIQGRTSLMAVDFQGSGSSLEHIMAIDEYVRSASNLTKQLLGAARGGKYDPKPTDLSGLIESSSTMFGRTRKEITIHTNYCVTPVVAVVDRAQIEQVLLNLYVNAWQAMPEGGTLHIESDTVSLTNDYCELHRVKPGLFAKISVADTGIGMNGAIQQQIFDPFFTTKEKGRGTGLGLASAYGILKNHDGFITVHSEIGQGSTFTLYLPLSEMEAHKETPAEPITAAGSERILLVDDEKMITDVGDEMLQVLGYSVICAQGGEEAIRQIKMNGKDIDLVILDLIMPKMDGGRTYDRIREIYPSIPVILSSGYAIDGQAAEIMARGCNGFMQKPFSLSKLSQKIRSVLDKSDT